MNYSNKENKISTSTKNKNRKRNRSRSRSKDKYSEINNLKNNTVSIILDNLLQKTSKKEILADIFEGDNDINPVEIKKILDYLVSKVGKLEIIKYLLDGKSTLDEKNVNANNDKKQKKNDENLVGSIDGQDSENIISDDKNNNENTDYSLSSDLNKDINNLNIIEINNNDEQNYCLDNLKTNEKSSKNRERKLTKKKYKLGTHYTYFNQHFFKYYPKVVKKTKTIFYCCDKNCQGKGIYKFDSKIFELSHVHTLKNAHSYCDKVDPFDKKCYEKMCKEKIGDLQLIFYK